MRVRWVLAMSSANEDRAKDYALVEAYLRFRGVNLVTLGRCCRAAVWHDGDGDDCKVLGEATTLLEAANLFEMGWSLEAALSEPRRRGGRPVSHVQS